MSVEEQIPVYDTSTPNASCLGACPPDRYITGTEFRETLKKRPEASGPDISTETLHAEFAATDVQKAEAYVASLPPSIRDRATDVVTELSPIGDAKDIHEGIKERSPANVLWAAASILPIGKLVQLGKVLKIIKAGAALKKEKNVERLIRFGSEAEAKATAGAGELVLRPGHSGPKRVAEATASISPYALGKRRNRIATRSQ
jgi:hypothetical protein